MKPLRIVPVPASGQPMLAQGTKILTADGSEISGVTKIELVAEVNDIWQARIHCNVIVDGELIVDVMPPEVVPPALERIEAKLDALLDALAEEGEDEPQYDLDGNLLLGARDQGQEL